MKTLFYIMIIVLAIVLAGIITVCLITDWSFMENNDKLFLFCMLFICLLNVFLVWKIITLDKIDDELKSHENAFYKQVELDMLRKEALDWWKYITLERKRELMESNYPGMMSILELDDNMILSIYEKERKTQYNHYNMTY